MESRVRNSASNLQFAILMKIMSMICSFVIRTAFIYSLGQEYVGVNGVFSNVLNLLSISEFGIGAAITYSFYKPIKADDRYHITQLFKLYKKIYYCIGIFTLLIGMLLYPFISATINDVPNVKYLWLIYILTLMGNVSTYFFAQYSTVIDVHQKKMIVTQYNLAAMLFFMPVKCIALIFAKSYILFLIGTIVENVSMNVLLRNKALRLYPYLEMNVDALGRDEINSIIKNVKNTGSMRAATMVLDASDNIIISGIISTVVVGSYATYIMIIMSIQGVIYAVKEACLSSLGNLCVSNDYGKRQEVFKKLQFLFNYFNGFAVLSMFIFLSPFIGVWAGSEYLLPFDVVVAMILVYYLRALQWPIEAFLYADGLFSKFGIVAWITSVLNIFLSILLGENMGLLGVVMGTILAKMLTTFWYEIYIVNKCSLHWSLKKYWQRVLHFCIFIFVTCVLGRIFTDFIDEKSVWFFVGLIPIYFFYTGMFYLVYKNTEEYGYFLNIISDLIRHKVHSN